MSGKPAARQGDMTKYGGPIVQGSLGVMIGAPSGVACSVCPGGVTHGNPVNPLLWAKVLPGETDIVLPGPLPFVLTRAYNSYQTKTPAPVAGCDGRGWNSLGDGGLGAIGQQVNSAMTRLPREDAIEVIHNVETMHNAYNPLGEYVFGWAIGAPLVGLSGISFGGAVLKIKAESCVMDVGEAVIVDGERDPKELVFTCLKGSVHEGQSGFHNKIFDFLLDSLINYKQVQ